MLRLGVWGKVTLLMLVYKGWRVIYPLAPDQLPVAAFRHVRVALLRLFLINLVRCEI